MNSHLQKCFYIKKFYIIDAQMGFACRTQARRPRMKRLCDGGILEKYSTHKRFDELGSPVRKVRVVHMIKTV